MYKKYQTWSIFTHILIVILKKRPYKRLIFMYFPTKNDVFCD